MTDEPQLPKSSDTPHVLNMPVSRRQDWRIWDAEISRLEEKCRKIKQAIARVIKPS